MTDKRRMKQAGLRAGLLEQRRQLDKRARMCLDDIESSTFVVDSPLILDGRAILVAATQLDQVLSEAAKVQGRLDELEDALGL